MIRNCPILILYYTLINNDNLQSNTSNILNVSLTSDPVAQTARKFFPSLPASFTNLTAKKRHTRPRTPRPRSRAHILFHKEMSFVVLFEYESSLRRRRDWLELTHVTYWLTPGIHPFHSPPLHTWLNHPQTFYTPHFSHQSWPFSSLM